MTVNIQLNGVNIVILAQNHNPTIASKDWLTSKGIMPEEPINFTHLPVFSNFESANFSLNIDNNRWSLRVKNLIPSIIEQLPVIADKYIKRLPETVYRAIGFNFDWRMKGEGLKPIDSVKSIFLNPKIESLPLLEKDNLKIRGIIEFSHEIFMVKVSMIPIQDNSEVQFEFNYHMKIDEKYDMKLLEESLKQFIPLKEHSYQFIEDIKNIMDGIKI